MTRTNLLVVDPDERVHRQFREAFKELGERVVVRCVTTRQEAVRNIREARAAARPFGVVIVDVDAPEVGVETVIESWQHQPELEVILCGRGPWSDEVRRLEALGGSDRVVTLRKPFDAVEARTLVACLAEKWQRGCALDDRLRDIDTFVQTAVDVHLKAHAQHDLSQRRSQRLEALGRLAAGLAHEINTPTQYASSSVEFIAEVLPLLAEALADRRRDLAQIAAGTLASAAAVERAIDPGLDELVADLPQTIDDARHGIEQIARIVKTVRSHAHLRDHDGVTSIDVNAQVEAAMELAKSEYKHIANALVELGEVPPVLGDPGDLVLAIMNLVINAAHAIREHQGAKGGRGEIRVTTRTREHHVEISIADSGGGIPPEIRERIFEPFFTTKPIGQGTGQGLSIARATIVERHQGLLSFETEVGRGTVFTVLLPRTAPEDSR